MTDPSRLCYNFLMWFQYKKIFVKLFGFSIIVLSACVASLIFSPPTFAGGGGGNPPPGNSAVNVSIVITLPANPQPSFGPYTLDLLKLLDNNSIQKTAQVDPVDVTSGSATVTLTGSLSTGTDLSPPPLPTDNNFIICIDDGTGTAIMSLCTHRFRQGIPTAHAISETILVPADAVTNGTLPANPSPSGTTTCSIPSVGWIICPVVTFVAKVSDSAYGFLAKDFLAVKIEAFTTDSTSTTYTAWGIMRNFANVAFVIAFLIIIFSQLTGIGISNYGVKKLLPRIIIAAILVNLSFFISQLCVDLSNILGSSMYDLFANLTPGATTSHGFWSTGGSTTSWTSISVLILAGVGAVATMWASLSALIPILILAFFALIMILFILVARQVIVILLVVISPLAFVAFLLPNTEQWFTKWRKTLTAMLLLYPIVALVFGVSIFASKILSTAMSSSGMIGEIAAASVVVLPLFVVPSLLKKSLDGVGKIGASLNNLGSRAGKGAGKSFTNSGYNQHRVAKQADTKKRMMTGNYRGKYGKANPRNWRSGLNRKLNKNRAFNAITGGYAASRELAGQTQDRKDVDDTIAMFGKDDDLAKLWAQTGGDNKTPEYENLAYDAAKGDPAAIARKAQFDKMRAAGYQRKASSHIAAAQMLSSGGKGSAGDITSALAHASSNGASDTTVAGAFESAKAEYRKNGRGDALGALEGGPANWAGVSASSVHREGIGKNNPNGAASYQAYLLGDRESTRKALVGHDQMESRAQALAAPMIIEAARKHEYKKAYDAAEAAASGTGHAAGLAAQDAITGIGEAKAAFGVR